MIGAVRIARTDGVGLLRRKSHGDDEACQSRRHTHAVLSRNVGYVSRRGAPQYGALPELVADVNDETLRRDPDLKASLERAGARQVTFTWFPDSSG